ncbi:MAG: GlyGly-CTERM sorting domain-containing protein [Myxococcota bacterium]|nr:GlyGly-CTERM sorting domain-containing protein [Myxococcota bacterium]
MKNLKLMMFAAAGLLVPAAAQADIARITQVKMVPSPTTDLAEVSGTPARLRRQNERQPGAENATFSINPDGKGGVFYVMSTELKGARPTGGGNAGRMQLAAVPFILKQDAAGAVVAEPNMATAKFVTNNNGDEYRNANLPSAMTVGDNSCVEYNYQINGGNDTKRYIKCFNPTTLAVTLEQTLLFEKNNDDCSMNQDGQSTSLISAAGGKYRFAAWRGCNGNGRDDAWFQLFTIDTTAGVKVTRNFDVSVLAREERSRGACYAADPSDLKFVVCGGTEGNNQPQRDGTWMIGIDADESKFQGANQQNSIIWKTQIGGRKQIGGIRTYAMRASIHPILAPDATGKMMANGTILWRQTALRGNNNTNGKGGENVGNELAVMKVSRAGMTYVTPMTDLAKTVLFGIDGTHLKFEYAMFGQTDALKPGFIFHAGSHTGGGYNSTAKVVMWDSVANKFVDGGNYAIASHDRHLYPNYTGNNPGNQGRDHADAQLIANPFVSDTNRDAYLMVIATTGKDPSEMTDPRKKLSAYLTIMPVAQNPAPAPQPQPQPQPSGQTDDPSTPEDETDPANNPSSGEALGGCSTSGGSAGFLSLLLIGLAAFIRRRR